MFVSPCSIRSAQCAALIALAAAAGITRIERTEAPDAGKNESVPVRTEETAKGSESRFFALQTSFVARVTQPWLAFARWVLSGETTSPSRVAASDGAAHGTAGVVAVVAETNAGDPGDFPPPTEKIRFAAAPRPALCTQDRLLPFAVGPPAGDAISSPDAADTFVSCNTTARGVFGDGFRIASPARVTAEARLARETCLSRELAGPTFSSAAPCAARRISCASLGLRAPTPFTRARSARAQLTTIPA